MKILIIGKGYLGTRCAESWDDVVLSDKIVETVADVEELINTHNPDLIITDIMMPFVSGLEVISHVRNKLNNETPIIVFSAAGQEEMVLKAFNLGANDFMGKPFSPNELVIRVKRLLG